MKKNNCRIASHVLGRSVAPLALSLALAPFLLSPLAVHAQLAAAPAGPAIGAAGNGTPIVNIVAPNAAGVSHNRFTDYNVGTQGVILNNSNAAVQTQLGGLISGNSQLSGGAAKVIINEVIGANASLLRGTTEVAGPSARLVIANPNGINVRGASFINVSRAVLTTGALTFDADGNLTRITADKGKIDVQGLDAQNVDQLDLIAHALNIADVKARNQTLLGGTKSVPIDLFQQRGFSGLTTDSSGVGSIDIRGVVIRGTGLNLGNSVNEVTGRPAISPQGLVTVETQPVLPVPPKLVAPVARQAEQAAQQRQQALQQAEQARQQEAQQRQQAFQQAEQARQQAAQQRQQALQQAEQARQQAALQRQQELQQAAQQRKQELQQAAQQRKQARAGRSASFTLTSGGVTQSFASVNGTTYSFGSVPQQVRWY